MIHLIEELSKNWEESINILKTDKTLTQRKQ